MTIRTHRFGDVEVRDEDVVGFPEGLVGLSSYKRFVMLRDPDAENVIWLQSVDRPDFALATVHSSFLDIEYRLEVRASEVESIQLESNDDAEVFVVINRVEGDYYANLRGPVIVNTRCMLGKQVVLRNAEYGVRHPLAAGRTDSDQTTGSPARTATAQVSISTRS